LRKKFEKEHNIVEKNAGTTLQDLMRNKDIVKVKVPNIMFYEEDQKG